MFTKSYNSPNAPQAIGPYSPALKLGDFVYLSGQLPLDPQSGKIVGADIQEQTYQVLKNIEAVLSEMNLETRHIVKTTVFLSDLADFDAMNEIYATYFAQPYPARSCVQVCALPKGAKIEIEALVIDTLVYEQQAASQSSCGCGDEGCGEGCGEGCECGGEDNDQETSTETCEDGCCCG
ncbi:MAG: RidA family protein [Erysipelotrichales bacterium]|nr:MAG: RidA family protein [Erysipelotrichales bacterium]